MAETYEEALVRFGAIPQTVPPPTPTSPAPTTIAPIAPTSQAAANAAANLSQNTLPSSFSVTPAMNTISRNARRDAAGNPIPLDFISGLPKMDYFFIASQRGPAAQLEAARRLYPDSNARVIDTGDLVMQVTDTQTGQPKDVVVNPAGLGPHDLIDLAIQAPEIAAGVAVGAMTGGTGFLATAGQIVLSALATGTTGYLRDTLTRASVGIPIDRAEILRARGADAAFDMFLGTGMGLGSKSLGVLSPFAKEKTPLQFDFEKAQQFFEQHFDETFQATPAELTGSPMLAAVEAFESKQPGVRTIASELRASGNAMVKRIQERALGNAASLEEVGARALDTVEQRIVQPLENALTQARDNAIKTGNAHVIDLLDTASGLKLGTRLTETTAGKVTLGQFDTRLAQAEKAVNDAYAQVKSLPGGSGDVLSGDAAAATAREIRAELPAVLKTVNTPTGLLDDLGRAITREEQQRVLLKSGVPEGLLKALDDLESLSGGKVSLQTLTNMKKAAYDSIAAFKTAHGDVKDRWFTKIAGAYEQGIQAGVDATSDPTLKSALQTAKQTYKDRLLPFERPGLKELAKDEFDTARLAPEQVVDRLFQGPKAIENYRMLEEVLGANNIAFRSLKRAWIDTQLAKATDSLTQTVDAGKLEEVFKSLNTDRPELAERMFGQRVDKALQTLAAQAKVQQIDNLSMDDIRVLLTTPNINQTTIKAVLDARKARDSAYINSIVKDVAEGVSSGERLRPMEFVKRLRNTDTPSAEVEELLATISKTDPQLRAAISDAQAYTLLDAASVREAATAGEMLAGRALNLSPSRLADALGRKGTDKWKRNALLLADDTRPGFTNLQLLENTVHLLSPREAVTASAFSTAGGMSGGAQIAQLTKSPTQYALTYAQKALLATVYKSETLGKLAANRAFTPPETAALANYLIASEPFVARLSLILGDESAAGSVVDSLKSSIDSYVSQLAQESDTPEGRQRGEIQRFLRGEPASVRIESNPRYQAALQRFRSVPANRTNTPTLTPEGQQP